MKIPARDAVSRTSRPAHGRSRVVSGWIRALGWLVIIASVLVILRALPTGQLAEIVQQKVEELGPWGPVAFFGLYVAAALVLLPAWPLTLVAGAVFGLLWGTALASIASIVTAALAFLTARYLARKRVERIAQRNRKFAAIDKAIGQGGWKVIALLRLSPAIPFSLGNYLYGVTPVRFWPYIIASWAAMLPGTFLYVYLGTVGKTAAAGGSSGGGAGKNPWQYVLLGVGLIATIVVTVYVTRLARKALDETALKGDPSDKSRTAGESGTKPGKLMAGAGVLAVLAVCAQLNGERLGGLFGAPKVTLREAHADSPDGGTFDHSAFEALLRAHVTDGGLVDYDALGKDAGALDAYIADLGKADIDSLGRDERLALLINAYNAFTLRLILDHYPVESIKDIPRKQRWDAKRWSIAGTAYSLDQIEHELIRPRFAEPRIHFALVCAAIGCPPLRREAYTGAGLEGQLTDQAEYVHAHPRWLRLHPERNMVELTELYDWYRSDFEHKASSIVAYAAQFSPDLARVLNAGKEPRVKFLDYSWKLNGIANRAEAEEGG